MNKTEIAENLFEAIDVILDQRMRKLRYSQCYLMEIVEETAVTGVYRVKYQGHIYKAMGLGYSYQPGDMVWVLAPRNTLDDELTIMSATSRYYRSAAPSPESASVFQGRIMAYQGYQRNSGHHMFQLDLGDGQRHTAYLLDLGMVINSDVISNILIGRQCYYREINGVLYIERPVVYEL